MSKEEAVIWNEIRSVLAQHEYLTKEEKQTNCAMAASLLKQLAAAAE